MGTRYKMSKIEPPKHEISELKRTLLNISTILELIEEGKLEKSSIPLIRSNLGKHMQDMDTRYLNLIKKLDDM